MKNTLALICIVILSAHLVRCTDDFTCDPGPYLGELKVKVTINDENPEVPITIFDGRFERRDTLISEVVDQSSAYYELEGGLYYSAAVLYLDGAKRVLAIDGKKLELSDDNEGCPTVDGVTLRMELAD